MFKNPVRYLVPFAALLAGASTFAAAEEPALTSPYFIDGLHCKGLYVSDVSSWILNDQEKEAAKKVDAEIRCEQVFAQFGIKKLMWLTPEDLEKLSLGMKQSGNFKKVELSIKKSELPNHVHLFMEAEPVGRAHLEVANDFRFYNGKDEERDLVSNRASVDFEDRSYLPNHRFRLGASYELARASDQLSGIDTAALDTHMQSRFDDPGQDWLQFRGGYELSLAPNWQANIGGRAELLRFGHELSAQVLPVLDAELLYRLSFFHLRGNHYFGPKLSHGRIARPQADGSFTGGTATYAGLKTGYFYGKKEQSFIQYDLYAEWAVGENSTNMGYDIRGGHHFDALPGILFTGEIVYEWTKNPLFLDHLRPSVGTYLWSYGIGAGKNFRYADNNHQITGRLGFESLRVYDNNTRHSPVLGVKYSLLSDFINVDVTASYYFKRLY